MRLARTRHVAATPGTKRNMDLASPCSSGDFIGIPQPPQQPPSRGNPREGFAGQRAEPNRTMAWKQLIEHLQNAMSNHFVCCFWPYKRCIESDDCQFVGFRLHFPVFQDRCNWHAVMLVEKSDNSTSMTWPQITANHSCAILLKEQTWSGWWVFAHSHGNQEICHTHEQRGKYHAHMARLSNKKLLTRKKKENIDIVQSNSGSVPS